MTMYDILKLSRKKYDNEFTCVDKDWDVEFYCYSSWLNDDADEWDKTSAMLAKRLQVVEIFEARGNIIFVTNLGELIENALANDIDYAKENLWYPQYCNIENIMDEIMDDLAGNVSEKWYDNFVNWISKACKLPF